MLDFEFCHLNHLTKFDLDLSRIQSPLDDLAHFSHLREVELFSTHPLSSYRFLTAWTQVRKLTPRTHMEQLPEEMRSMQSLQELHLEDNPLTDLPAWIANLPSLQALTFAQYAQPKDISITEYPAVLRACPALLYCDLGIPAHSLYGLPSIARYWGALLWTYQKEGSHAFDLPESIKRAVVDELGPTFSFDYGSGEGAAGIAHWYRMQRHQAPNHPQLAAFLDAYYAESYETLFDRVRRGEKLTDDERERFVHETTHQYYLLLCNTDQKKVDSTLLDELGQKFSVQLNDTTQILL